MYSILHHTARRFWLVRRQISERQTGQEENYGKHRRRPTKEIGRAGCTEQTARRTTAERRAHVGTFPVLNKNKPDNPERGEDMNQQDD